MAVVLSTNQALSPLGMEITRRLNQENKQAESTAGKTGRVFFYILAGGVSCASCIIPSYIALTYDNGNSRFLSVAGIVGVGIDFAILGTYGWTILIDQIAQRLSMSNQDDALFNNHLPCTTKVSLVFGSIVWGAGGRIQAIGLAIIFAGSIPWGIVGAVGGGGPAILSAFNMLSKVRNKFRESKCLSNASERDLVLARKELLASLEQFKITMFKISPEKRQLLLQSLFPDSIMANELTSIHHIFSQILDQANIDPPVQESCCTRFFRGCARVITAIPPSMVMLQLWLLTNTVLEQFSNNPWINGSVSSVAVSSYLFFTFNESQNTITHLFNKTVGTCANVNNTPSEIEAFFPRLHYLLDLLALAISLLPYSELTHISQHLADENRIFTDPTVTAVLDIVFIQGSYAGWVMIIFQSIRNLIVKGAVRIYAGRSGDEQVKETLRVLKKIEALQAMIEEANDESLALFLQDTPGQKSLENETTPLLQTAT